MTANVSSTATMLRRSLTMGKAARGGEIGAGGVLAPERPVMTAGGLEVVVRDAQAGELGGEGPVLRAQRIVAAGVDPEVGAEPVRDVREQGVRVVRRHLLQVRTEDRAHLVRPLVA